MEFLIYLFVFILGSAVGSFLNCVIYRLETSQDFVFGRSFCPHCKHLLNWKDLIPILSFLILKGKCRYCQKRISFQYPLVEISTAFLFLLNFYQFRNHITLYSLIDLIFLFIISSFLVVIFVYDLKHYLIPDNVIYLATGLTLFYQFFKVWNFGHWSLFEIWNLVIGVLPSLFFLMIILISRETWMGFGDFKLSILMGLLLGWPKILIAIFFAFLSGAVVGIILILLKQKTMKSQIPFAPFLIFGFFIALFFGGEILEFIWVFSEDLTMECLV